MADYSITFARSARKEIEALEEKIVKRILPDIKSLAKTPLENLTTIPKHI